MKTSKNNSNETSSTARTKTTPVETPVAKRPGRPKKMASTTQTNAQIAEPETVEKPVAKRPGRPKKTTTPTQTNAQIAEPETVEKPVAKRPGRPRKITTQTQTNAQIAEPETVEKPVAKRPGRPRKIAPTQTNAQIAEPEPVEKPVAKRPGRPRKITTQTQTNAQIAEPETVEKPAAKRPGRPRKTTTPTQTNAQIAEPEPVEKPAAKRPGRPRKTATPTPFANEIIPRPPRVTAKERNLPWEPLKHLLLHKNVAELVDIIGKLYRFSDDSAEFIRSLFAKVGLGTGRLLNEFRQKIITPFGLELKLTYRQPRIGALKKTIRDYLKGTGDVRGTVDLWLTLQETALAFTMKWGDINDQFYDPLISAAEESAKLAAECDEREEIFKEFKDRLLKLGDEACGLGWGFGAAICEMVEDIFYANGIGLKREYRGKWHTHFQLATYELEEEDDEDEEDEFERIKSREEEEGFKF